MSEQDDVIGDLGAAGVLAGIRWAYLSAAERVAMDYSEAAGHDAAWAGTTRFILFRDRLDRVFTCGRYALGQAAEETTGLDILRAELSAEDIRTMPALAHDLVERDNLNGSPGWAWEDWRWLLASSDPGKIDAIPWPRKSPTKQRVAKQRNPDPDQPSLFDALAAGELPGLEALAELEGNEKELDRKTLVVAHAQDIDHDDRELVLGRARHNAGGGNAWHWRQDILSGFSSGGGRGTGGSPLPTSPNDGVPDAPVRLRPSAEKPSRSAGEQ